MAIKKKKSPVKKTVKSSASGSRDWRDHFTSKREKNGNVIFTDKDGKEKMFKGVGEALDWANKHK